MNNISFFSEDIDFQIENPSLISQWITKTIIKENFHLGEISLIFTSDDYLLKINQEHLNHDYYTDIITFNYVENQMISGDLFISIDRVKDNSKLLTNSFNDELNRVIIHGVLHLLGYNDKSQEEISLMREKEDFYLSLQSEN